MGTDGSDVSDWGLSYRPIDSYCGSMDQDQAVALLEQHREVKQAELAELLRKYDVVEAHYDPSDPGGSYAILAEPRKGAIVSNGKGFSEMGTVDPSPFTAWTRLEHVPELRGKQGLRTFYDMSRNDNTVRGGLRIIKTPIQGADWYIEPASKSVIDQNIAKFVENNLFEGMESTWEQFIEDCLRSIDYGFFTFEKVYAFDTTENKIKIKKMSPLHPLDIQGWNYHEDGSIIGLTMEQLNSGYVNDKVEIPWNKLLNIVFEMEGGDLRGTSILRSSFKHWYYKETLYKIDAIQKERHGIGVPVIKLPLGYTKDDKTAANDLGRNLRTNERAYITAPANWEIYFAKLEGQPVDPIPSIEHHDKKIYEGILAAFMGSTQISKESMDTFYKSTRYVARSIAACINRWVIRDLVDMNFSRKGGYPKLKARKMGEWEDLRTMTFALRNMIGAKAITPDLPLEEWARKQMDLPDFDEKTARGLDLVPPDENVGPPEVKGSRQKDLPMVDTPSANAGTDRSGGSK